jgi:hypothetical protein
MSHGVVGLVDDDTERRVQALWAELDERFGIADLRHRVPWPHVSFAVAERIIDRDHLAEATEALARDLAPLAIGAPSWAVFTGPGPSLPAVVRSVTRTPALDAAQRQVATTVASFLLDVSELYTPEAWNPHITVTARDHPAGLVGEVVQWLADNDGPAWQAQVTRLGLIVDHDGSHELACDHPLRGASGS